MQSRLVRYAALAGLSVMGACAQDPKTHVPFTIDASAAGGGGGGATDAAATGETPIVTFDASMIADGGTSGCGMDPGQNIGEYVEYHISISGPDLDATNKPKVRDRIYYVRLPTTYDATTPLRVVYLGTGCGGTTSDSVIQLNKASNEQAILVAPMPLIEFGQCFDETVNSVEYPFFDALHKKIESSFCVDPARQFYAGFSTGARLGNMLGCVFPDVLRAFATVQGALPPLPACKDHPIANFTMADTLETGNPYAGNVMASQHVLAANKCQNPTSSPSSPPPLTTTYDPGTTAACTNYNGPITCVKYAGCPGADPVVFCTTTAAGHTPCEPWSDFAFWNFFKAF